MAFFDRQFVLLWQGQLVSHLGNQAFLIATTLYVVNGTGSATLVAGAMMAATMPLVLLAPIGGTVADRHSRRSILIATDFGRGLAVGTLALFVLWQPALTHHHIVLLLTVALINGVMSALFAPAFQAFVPDLVPRERLAAANSANQMATQGSTLVGQALGGVLYVAWGPALLLVIDALSFVYAGVATWLIRRDQRVLGQAGSVRRAVQQYALDARAGLAYLRRRPGMLVVLGIFAGVNCLFMPVFVLLPFYTSEVLGAGAEWYGFLLSAAAVGALAGSLAAGVVLPNVRNRAALVRTCLGGIAAGVLLLAVTAFVWLALLAFVAIGCLSSLINVAVITAFQSAVGPEIRGRIMALVIAISTAAVPIGMGVGGALGDVWRSSLAGVIAGCGLAIAGLACASWVPGFGAVFVAEEPRPSP